MKTTTGNSGYEIRLKGHLDARWCAWFDGWSITNLSGSTSPAHAGQKGLTQKGKIS
jgi:hypothetical protein